MNVQATVDQLGATVRDTFASMGVDLEDPVQVHAVRCAFLIIDAGRDQLDWVLAAVGTAAAPPRTRP